MRTTYAAICLTLAFGAVSAQAHEPNSRVAVALESPAAVQAGDISVSFDLQDTQTGKALSDAELELSHEKKLHCFFFDPALKEFRHEHPTFDGSHWHVSTHLDVNGDYWMWLQGQLAADHSEFASSARISVAGGNPANAVPIALGDVRQGSDGNSVVQLSSENFEVGQTVMPMLTFTRNDGTQPQITPYLGAMAHVLIVSQDGDSILHVHPMNSGTPTQMMIHTEFQSAGDYRIWVQFLDANVLKIIPLSVTVH